MAKLITMFFILIALQACLILYANPTTEDTDIWTFVTNVDNWNSLTFILGLIGIAVGIGVVGIAIAGFGYKTDFLIFSLAIAGFISMGVVFVNLANVLRDELIARFFTSCAVTDFTSTACSPVNWIIAIVIGPLAFYYVWTVIEWWRGKDY